MKPCPCSVIIVGLATIGIYYIGKRFMNNTKKVATSNPTPKNDQPVLIPQKQRTVVVATPSMNMEEMDVIKWVENE